jgi:hypothetical protein
MYRVKESLSDTNIGEIATIVGLARGCSPTHILIVNRMSLVTNSMYSYRHPNWGVVMTQSRIVGWYADTGRMVLVHVFAS